LPLLLRSQFGPGKLLVLPLLFTFIPSLIYFWQTSLKSQPELRLGLQEALVNAATHGNQLDPGKRICVRYAIIKNHFWWVISDQGKGCRPCTHQKPVLPAAESESGRGLFILTQVFDQVHWNHSGTELHLCKQVARASIACA
jgi:anti-sigma regulatory factor (Ser/Thr protein kinase)